ncbi:hypothetical protein F3Y22_tig00110637pilonHSYRG00317 [Hibiscus syriacus]|uniref:Uncharacterized protein n=1 Tax=Hibiscus syriacus TaxID=106335 RepID=A0A6A2ZY27_HIBSY|nr:hypothetical protein F3Y22_tig00110637pilonHSYRG00317 [Hibiscus syriacus]
MLHINFHFHVLKYRVSIPPQGTDTNPVFDVSRYRYHPSGIDTIPYSIDTSSTGIDTTLPNTLIKLKSEGGRIQQVWEKWSNNDTEQQVAKLMEEDVGATMQLFQSKSLCIMHVSLATTIYHTHLQDASAVKPKTNPPP